MEENRTRITISVPEELQLRAEALRGRVLRADTTAGLYPGLLRAGLRASRGKRGGEDRRPGG